MHSWWVAIYTLKSSLLLQMVNSPTLSIVSKVNHWRVCSTINLTHLWKNFSLFLLFTMCMHNRKSCSDSIVIPISVLLRAYGQIPTHVRYTHLCGFYKYPCLTLEALLVRKHILTKRDIKFSGLPPSPLVVYWKQRLPLCSPSSSSPHTLYALSIFHSQEDLEEDEEQEKKKGAQTNGKSGHLCETRGVRRPLHTYHIQTV